MLREAGGGCSVAAARPGLGLGSATVHLTGVRRDGLVRAGRPVRTGPRRRNPLGLFCLRVRARFFGGASRVSRCSVRWVCEGSRPRPVGCEIPVARALLQPGRSGLAARQGHLLTSRAYAPPAPGAACRPGRRPRPARPPRNPLPLLQQRARARFFAGRPVSSSRIITRHGSKPGQAGFSRTVRAQPGHPALPHPGPTRAPEPRHGTRTRERTKPA